MKHKNCVGCKEGSCSKWAIKHAQDCPCGICLIKMMCSKGCEDWREWYYHVGEDNFE